MDAAHRRDERDVAPLADDRRLRRSRPARAVTSPSRPYSRLCSKKSTGLSSSIAARSSAFASPGVDGATILIPGMPMNHDAGICEWIAPKRPPAPTTERITTGHAHLAAGQEPVLRHLVDDAVHDERQEVAEHDLDDGPQAVDGGAERGPGERELRDRRVEDALGAVLLVQARRHREHAAGDGDVLAEEDHPVVGGERLVERLAERAAEVHHVPGGGLRVGAPAEQGPRLPRRRRASRSARRRGQLPPPATTMLAITPSALGLVDDRRLVGLDLRERLAARERARPPRSSQRTITASSIESESFGIVSACVTPAP